LTLLAATEKYEMGAVQSSIRAEVSRKKLLSPTDSGGGIPHVRHRVQQKAYSRDGDRGAAHSGLPTDFRKHW
jgi:hypothetical protein